MSLQAKYKFIQVATKSHLKIIQFNRPQKKNAIHRQMYEEVITALNDAANDENIVVTALTGAGDYYSSGNDISAVAEFMGEDIQQQMKQASLLIERYVKTFIDFPKILVAVVNGPAVGIATTTLGLCDIVYASDKATFSTPFTTLGLCAEGCSSYTFPRIMGYSKASELLYCNHTMNAHEAKQFCFVSEVIPHHLLEKNIWPALEKISNLPPNSLLCSKRLVRNNEKETLHKVCEAECKELEERWESEECLNAIIQFMQRKSKL